MAVLETIRKRMRIFLLVMVGMAILFFVVNPDNFFTGRSVSNDIAQIKGQEISYQVYNERLEKALNFYRPRFGGVIDDATMEQLQNQVWEQLLRDIILGDEYQTLGVNIHADEVADMVYGKNIDPMVQSAFMDRNTQQYNPAAAIDFLKNIDKATPEQRQTWLYIENQLIDSRKYTKYNNLIAKGLYVNSLQAKNSISEKNNKVDFEYIVLPYANIADSSIKITPSEVRDYYNENKKTFKQDVSRDVTYLSFDVTPTAADERAALDWITSMKSQFETAEDAEKFIAANGNSANVDRKHFAKGELAPAIDSIMFSNKVGFVYGPYLDGNIYKLTRLVSKKMIPDSVKARHILIQPNGKDIADMARAQAIADSLLKAIKGGSKFEDLAKAYSADKSNSDKGGDLEWFAEGAMVREFNDSCFNAKEGKIMTVATQFGVHIVEITGRGKEREKVSVATLERPIEASETTRKQVYAQASKFIGQNNTGAKLLQAIEDQKLNRRLANALREMDNRIPGLNAGMDSPRDIVRAAYEAKKGDVLTKNGNPVFELADNFVIAMLTDIRDNEYAKVEDVKVQIEDAVRKQKKAKMLMDKVTAAGASSIDDLAAKVSAQKGSATGVTFSSFSVPNAGPEPKVIGAATTLPKGQLSKPIEGNMGVFVLVVTNVSESQTPADTKDEQSNLMRNMQQRITNSYFGSSAFDAVKEKANIKDYRSRFF